MQGGRIIDAGILVFLHIPGQEQLRSEEVGLTLIPAGGKIAVRRHAVDIEPVMQQGMAKLMGADIVQHVLRRLRADDDDANPAVFHVQPVHLLQLCIGYLDAAELRQVEGIAGIMAFYQFPDTL